MVQHVVDPSCEQVEHCFGRKKLINYTHYLHQIHPIHHPHQQMKFQCLKLAKSGFVDTFMVDSADVARL